MYLTPTPFYANPILLRHFTPTPRFRPHVFIQLQVSDSKFTPALYSDPRIQVSYKKQNGEKPYNEI